MKPGNAPPLCPRGSDESSGPRRCRYTSCPNHMQHRDAGRMNAKLRELAREQADMCCVDLSERARAAILRGAPALTRSEVAAALGTDAASIARTERRALKKLKIILDGR